MKQLLSVIYVLLLIYFVSAQNTIPDSTPKCIGYRGQVLTIHPYYVGPWGDAIYNVTFMDPKSPPDNAQAWTYVQDPTTGHYFIQSVKYNWIVLDAANDVATPTQVIGFQKKTPTAANQLWIFNADGSIRSNRTSTGYMTRAGDIPQVELAGRAQLANVNVYPCSPQTLNCTGWGDPHYSDFFGATFDNQTLGSYCFAATESLTVTATAVLCGNGVTCHNGVNVTRFGTEVYFTLNDKVYINGVQQNIPYYQQIGDASLGFYITKENVGRWRVNTPEGYVNFYQQNNVYGDVSAHLLPGKYSTLNPHCYCSLNYVPPDPPTPPLPTPTPEQNACCGHINATLRAQCSFLGTRLDAFIKYCFQDTLLTGLLGICPSSIDAAAVLCLNSALNPSSISLPASALLSVAFGAGLKTELSLSTAYSFTIQAVDAAGRNLTRGGDAAAWTITSAVGINFAVTDNNDGTYLVNYVAPPVVGPFLVNVGFNGWGQITASPFSLVTVVTDALKTVVVAANGITNALKVLINLQTSVIVQARSSTGTARDTGNDVLQAQIVGALGTVFPPVYLGDGNYQFNYLVVALGSFQLKITINGQQIQGSPFTLQALLG